MRGFFETSFFWCSPTLSAILFCMVIIEFGMISEIGNKELLHDVIDYKDSCLPNSVQKSAVAQVLSCSPNNVFKPRTEFGKYDNISLKPPSAHMKEKSVDKCSKPIFDDLLYMQLSGRKHILLESISLRIFSGKNATKPLHNNYLILLPAVKVLLTTLVSYLVFFCRKSSYSSKLESEIKTSNVYKFVFQFRHQFTFELNVFHFSLKKYLNEIERKSDKNTKRMNHEWARYESFKTFPKDCAISSLRLAQSGFYHTGKGVEAICFCCGLRNEKWADNESVFELHKRLSPNCKFMKGEKTENAPIHGSENSKQHDTSGACGGPEDFSETNREQTVHRNELTRTRTGVLQETEQNIEHLNTLTGDNYQNSLENEGHPSLPNGYSGRYSEYRPTDGIQHFPGITTEQPKHQDYAVGSVRVSSFSQWPSSQVMKPGDLADAGFFFTGIQDLVRCFFCGGGMKHWEYGDSPWIEHARWFPTCAYLKQCKGEDFVNLCQMSNMAISTQTNFELRELDSQHANIAEDQHIRDLNSTAAKLVLDMGYTQKHVEDAIRQIRQRISPAEELKAQHLLEYLLDNSSTRDYNTTVITTQQQHRDTINNSAQSSPPNTSASTNTTERLSPDVRAAGCQTADQATEAIKAPKDERKSLKEENRHLKEQMVCKICMDKDANIVFLPCGHLVSCVECAHALRKCAVCRTIIEGTVRAYPA